MPLLKEEVFHVENVLHVCVVILRDVSIADYVVSLPNVKFFSQKFLQVGTVLGNNWLVP